MGNNSKNHSEDVRASFGERLRELRNALGISQEDFAFECDLDRSYVGQVERGEKNISLENIHRLARGLKIAPTELLMPVGSKHSVGVTKPPKR